MVCYLNFYSKIKDGIKKNFICFILLYITKYYDNELLGILLIIRCIFLYKDRVMDRIKHFTFKIHNEFVKVNYIVIYYVSPNKHLHNKNFWKMKHTRGKLKAIMKKKVI